MDDISELRGEAAATPAHRVWTKGGPVFSHLAEDTVRGLEGRAMASFGDAATLGMWAFATGIWTTGLFQSNLLPLPQTVLLFPGMLTYAGIVLLIAGLLLFRRNDAFLGSSFCSFAALNITRVVLLICQNRGMLPSGATADLLQGCLLESFAYIALSLLLAAVRLNLVLGCTFFGYALAGLYLLIHETGPNAWSYAGEIGGYFMFAAGFFAYYGGTAVLVNSAWRRVVLPIGGET
jgi:uncharacterized protein